MGGKLDFSIIIAALVLLQLYVLGMNVKKESKAEKVSKVRQNFEDGQCSSNEQEGMSLTVHRSNGEEKVYTKSNVA